MFCLAYFARFAAKCKHLHKFSAIIICNKSFTCIIISVLCVSNALKLKRPLQLIITVRRMETHIYWNSSECGVAVFRFNKGNLVMKGNNRLMKTRRRNVAFFRRQISRRKSVEWKTKTNRPDLTLMTAQSKTYEDQHSQTRASLESKKWPKKWPMYSLDIVPVAFFIAEFWLRETKHSFDSVWFTD